MCAWEYSCIAAASFSRCPGGWMMGLSQVCQVTDKKNTRFENNRQINQRLLVNIIVQRKANGGGKKEDNSGLRHFMFHRACFQTCLTKTFYRARKKKEREKFIKPNTRKGKRIFRCCIHANQKLNIRSPTPVHFTPAQCEKQGDKNELGWAREK